MGGVLRRNKKGGERRGKVRGKKSNLSLLSKDRYEFSGRRERGRTNCSPEIEQRMLPPTKLRTIPEQSSLMAQRGGITFGKPETPVPVKGWCVAVPKGPPPQKLK